MSATQTELPELLRVREAAKVLRIGRTKCFALIKSGELDSVLVGQRGRRIPREVVVRYLAAPSA